MFRLETLGGLALTSGGSERPQPRRRLALFARLALPGDHGVGREELLALLWPERDTEGARHSLDQLLYEARRSLDTSPTVGTSSLRLNAEAFTTDVAEYRAALDAGDSLSAVSLYRGPFLHAFYLRGASEFERWVERQRSLLAADHLRTLESLAAQASREGRPSEAVDWWRRVVAEDRFSSRSAVSLMRALADLGDSAGALEFARLHETIVRSELDSAPDAAVVDLANALRMRPRETGLPTGRIRAPVVDAPATGAVQSRPNRGRRRPRTLTLIALTGLLASSIFAVRELRHDPIRTSVAEPPPAGPHAGATVREPHTTTSIEAHDLYERGKDPVLIRSDSGVRLAIAYLEQATALDSNFAAAYATLASRCATAAFSSDLPVVERRAMYDRAYAAARRAVVLDDSLADAHVQLGYILMVGYNPVVAEAELKRALALDPRSTEAREILVKAYEWTGRPDEAVVEARRAVSLDPLSPALNAELGYALYFARQTAAAVTQLAKVASIQPPLRRVADYRAMALASNGQVHEALAVLRPAKQIPRYQALTAQMLVRSGERAEASEVLGEMLDAESRGLARAGEIVDVYAALGEYDRAFAWLDRAIDEYSLWPEIMGPIYEDLHRDPRFERVYRRLGLAPSAAPPEKARATASR